MLFNYLFTIFFCQDPASAKKFETELYVKLEQWQTDLVKQVRSVVGIGKRATAILIVSTQGFKYTETYQQLISYTGLSPKEYSSGSSIRGRVRICKQGGSLLRHTLYSQTSKSLQALCLLRCYGNLLRNNNQFYGNCGKKLAI